MIDDLVSILRRARTDLTPEEVASAVWLAAYLPGGTTTGMSPAATPLPTQQEPPRDDEAVEPTTAAEGPLSAPTSTEHVRSPAPSAGLYLAPRVAAGDETSSIATWSPGVAALSGKLEISRALRPLHRTVPSARDFVLDEEQTADVAAQTGVVVPCLRPAAEKGLDLLLVIDRSPSMVLWEATSRELRSVFEQLGAFRDVQVWSITASGESAWPTLHRESDFSASHSPHELIDATGRRLVVVLSDCISPMWHGPDLLRWLDIWGRRGPVCILQPLPQRLWHRCTPRLHQVRLWPTRSGSAHPRLRAEMLDPLATMPLGATAIPVLELAPRWLAAGASLISGVGPPRDTMAVLTVESPAIVLPGLGEPGPEEQPRPEMSALARVQRFRATSSPDARRLAEFLAAAPLTLPVMRLVQRLMMPSSQPHDLAEVFLSGLIQRVSPDGSVQDAERVEYDFQKGVRNVLLPGIRVGEALQILDEVSEFVNAHLGTSFDFPALLAGQGSTEPASELGRPFASVAHTVLQALGGRYAALATQLVSSFGRPQESAGDLASEWRTALPPDADSMRRTDMAQEREPDGTDSRFVDQPAIWGEVPPRNPEFTGREKLLDSLRRQLTGSITALLPHALHGLGGVGKTQLAIEYIYRYASSYDLIWWISAEQPAVMRSTLAGLGLRLGLPPADDLSQALVAVYDALRTGRQYRRWLLVFDNATRAEDLAPFLSNPGSGHVLITSRSRNWSGIAETVEVDVFDRLESKEMITRRLPDVSEDAADALADKLGDLPLALEQATAWMLATAMPITEYLDLLDKRVSRLLAESSPSVTYSTPVAVVWGVAFEQLAEQTPEALQLLELCAFFGAEPIPVPLLSKGPYAGLPGVLNETVGEDLRLRRAVRDIARYGLAKVDQSRNSIQVHRLVQAVLRDRLPVEARDSYRRSVQKLLAVVDPGDPTDDPRTWERHAELGPHIVPSGAVEGESSDVRRVVVDQIRYLYVSGDYESSRELAARAYSAWRQKLGPADEQTLVAARFLGNALRSTGRTTEARELNSEAHALARSVLGEDHEHTLALAVSVAADLRLFGEWRRARDLDEELLERHKRVFGDDDSNTLRCANNLAVDFRLLGNFQAAYRWDEDTWNRRRRIIGDDHPDTLFTVSSLSRDVYGLGDYARALTLQRQWLPVHRARLGPDHSNVLRATRIHADTLRKAGAFHEAVEVSQEVHQRYRRRFGVDHIDTVGAAMTLFGALSKVDRLTEARIVGEEALGRYGNLLGEDHPFTLVCMTNLAIVLRAVGEFALARSLDEQAVQGLTSTLGPAHAYTICTVTNLANNLAVARDHRQARAMLEPNLALAREHIGPTHSETLACAGNLAFDLQASGEPERGRELRDQTVAGLRVPMNGAHPDLYSYLAGRRLSCIIDPPTT